MAVAVFVMVVVFMWFCHCSPADPPVDLFGLKGGPVYLTVEGRHERDFKRIAWMVNNTIIVEYTKDDNDAYYYGDYKQRMKLHLIDFSLLIKKLEERDSGVYTLRITDPKGRETELKYNLSVQEAVPKPIIRIKLLSNSTDGFDGFCNMLVKCSVKQSWVSYTCDLTQCTQTAHTPWAGVNITVMFVNGAVICSGNNRVSSENQTKSAEHACSKQDKLKNHSLFLLHLCLLGFYFS